MDVLQKLISDYQPRSLVYSSNEEVMVLYAPKSSARLSLLYNEGANRVDTISSRYILEASNHALFIQKETQQIAKFDVVSDTTPRLSVFGNVHGDRFEISQGVQSSKTIVLQDYNALSTTQFAGFGYRLGILNHQLPTRYGRYVFQAAATDEASAEWMRIQEDILGNPQVGIGTMAIPSNVSFMVRGNAIIDGRLTVQGGIAFDTSAFVKLDQNNRLQSNQLPEKVPLLNPSNKIDESILPSSYNFQFLKGQKNVGIGTRRPMQKLHVHGSSVVSERIGVGTLAPANRLHIVENSGSIGTLRIENNGSGPVLESYLNGQPALTIAGTHAAVGIGTTVVPPTTTLFVNGNTVVNGMLSCTNFTVNQKLQVTDLEVTNNQNFVIFKTELLNWFDQQDGIPYVRSSVPYIFTNGIATNTISTVNYNASSPTKIRFRNCGIEVDAESVFNAPISTSSDMRYKYDIERVNDALTKIANIHGYSYHMGNGKRYMGVLAQEVMETLPYAVTTTSDMRLAVRYDTLIPVLIECIHELKCKIQNIEKKRDL